MRNVNIDTGKKPYNNVNLHKGTTYNQGNDIVVFDYNTTSKDTDLKTSLVLMIPDGRIAIFTAYNLKEDIPVTLYNIGNSLEYGHNYHAIGRSPITYGTNPGGWSLINYSDPKKKPFSRMQIILPVPGNYMMFVDDSSVFPELTVIMSLKDKNIMPTLPAEYYGGMGNRGLINGDI